MRQAMTGLKQKKTSHATGLRGRLRHLAGLLSEALRALRGASNRIERWSWIGSGGDALWSELELLG